VSSRARPQLLRRVLEHLLEDDVRKPAFDAAHRLHRGFAVGFLAVVVVATLAGVADLDAGHDVQHPVDLPVAAAGEAVPDLVTGGGVDGGGAVPGREVVAVGNRVMSPTSTSGRAAPEGPMPGRSSRLVPVASRSSVSSLLAAFLRGMDPFQVADQLGGDAASGLADRVTGRTLASNALA